ncbi:MAG: class I SAM-dependent methyltransferase [Halieaceae bacterium]
MTDNSEQIEYWNGSAGENWVETYPLIDRLLEPLSSVAVTHANAQAGQKVIDVGCGCGGTSLKLAEQGAQVLGVDISAPMVAEAQRRAQAVSNLTFGVADASTTTYTADHQLAFSRFGVMFFADPVAAFSNIRAALVPGGRLVFICWQSLMVNPWIAIPGGVIQELQPAAAPPDPEAPGPFSLADETCLRETLTSAGFSSVSVDSLERELTLGTTMDEAMLFQTRIGPLSSYMAEHPGEEGEAAKAKVEAALSPYQNDSGVRMNAATWLVTAQA